jgi:hypothetical protein
MSHSATIRGKRACRHLEGRTKGVLWHHASVNLVVGHDLALGRGAYSPANAEDRLCG